MSGPEEPVALVLAVRDAWLAALKARDVDRLMELVTEDIVMMHPNGRTYLGKNAVGLNLRTALQQFAIDEKVESDETVVSGDWAFDRAKVRTTLTPASGGSPLQVNSEAVTILRRQPDGCWKIARTIAVLR